MDNKKLITIISLGIVVFLGLSLWLVFGSKENKNINESNTAGTEVVPTKEVEFVVVRVLPSGFSPSEVTIKKGMIVRFTNPLEDKVALKWEGATQYTNEAVYEGNDIATTVFDIEGEYTFTDDANHVGKVVVR